MAIAGLVSCSDDFDAPPVKVPTATIKANTTIADFKAEYWKTETPYCVPVNVPEGESKVISGRVISSDATGNIYKSLVIQDETAALAISINANSLYTTYRVGQEVVIDLNGMYVGKYANLIQLGYPNEGTRGTEAGFMALELFESHAQLNGLPDVSKIDTIPVSISELPTTPAEICKMQSQLVRLDNVQWVEAGQRYSEESASTSRNLKDASGNTIIVRNSNYATFRTELLPEGEGTVIGILSYYNNAWQILLRSAEDVIGFKTPEGVMANPYTIERAKELQGQDITGWVAGYIVGAVAPGVNEVKANTDIQWGIEAAMDNSLVIGATADTKDIANCVIVPLPQDTKLRELGNIRDHKDLVGKAIKVKGVLENQYAQAGVNCSGALGTFEIEGVETGGDGTLNNPYNIAAITSLASGLASGAESSEVYFKGKVSSIKFAYEAEFGTGTFYVSDDGSTTGQFYVYRALYLGNQKWVNGNYQIKVGDEVVIHGKVTNYMGNTPETVQNAAYLYSINGSTTDPGSGSTGGGETGGGETGGGETGGGETGGGEVTGNQIKVTFADFGIANGTAVTTLNLSDGTTLTFDGGGNTNAPKYYTAGTNVRMYPKNSMTVNSSKKIASIVINCDTYNGTLCNAAEQVTASAGAVTFSGSDINIGTIDATTTTVTNANPNTGTASQIRMISMTITYAE